MSLRMHSSIAVLPAPAPGPAAGWLGVATRPGSGLAFLPAALSAQLLVTVTALLFAAVAAALTPRRPLG